jgi:hypothetical protein
MRAAVMYCAGEVGIADVPDAGVIDPGDAVLRIRRACICVFRSARVAGGPAPIRVDMEKLLPDVLEGRIRPARAFDRTVDLDGVPAGYRATNAPESIEVMVRF